MGHLLVKMFDLLYCKLFFPYPLNIKIKRRMTFSDLTGIPLKFYRKSMYSTDLVFVVLSKFSIEER